MWASQTQCSYTRHPGSHFGFRKPARKVSAMILEYGEGCNLLCRLAVEDEVRDGGCAGFSAQQMGVNARKIAQTVSIEAR